MSLQRCTAQWCRMTEWKPIPGWPIYEASDDGKIRSIDRTTSAGNPLRGCVLSQQRRTTDGIMIVGLYNRERKKQMTLMVHRLVALAFLGEPGPQDVVVHLDGNARNNCVSNLRYVSRSDHQRGCPRLGRIKPAAA